LVAFTTLMKMGWRRLSFILMAPFRLFFMGEKKKKGERKKKEKSMDKRKKKKKKRKEKEKKREKRDFF